MASTPPAQRTAWVSGERLPGWVKRFSNSHGTLHSANTPSGLQLTAADAATALLEPPWPPTQTEKAVSQSPPDLAAYITQLAAAAQQPYKVAVLLLRRGGYALGLVQQGKVLASTVGSRYVQSRTAAGGWSQQRFARRRANQAQSLVRAVASKAAALPLTQADFLALGGDKTLCEELLDSPELRALAGRPRLKFLTVPDPKAATLQQTAARVCSVQITVTDPPPDLATASDPDNSSA